MYEFKFFLPSKDLLHFVCNWISSNLLDKLYINIHIYTQDTLQFLPKRINNRFEK